ncbi:MAG: hypothetical protein JWQ93_3335 [Marmoricola sp.]|nr:hypothetical protein [Marmoricola sp.]
MGDAGVQVNRWRRFGKDRLYVSHNDEVKIGWWDLTTDEGYPETPADAAALAEAVADWKAGRQTDASLGGADTTQPREAAVRAAKINPPRSTRDTVVAHVVESVPVQAPVGPTVAVSPDREERAMRPWLDLSTNAPGAEAREQALAAREAAPVKSLLARVLGVHTDERAWRIGADGEERVAARLAKLANKDPRWRSLHAIPVGNRGSDIDHLVIGPGGVFTLNTKHHPGAKIWVGGDTFMVDGHKQPYIRNSRHEASRAAKLLTAACGFPVHVEGVIVTVNADDIVVKKAPAGVHVVPRMQIARWLGRNGPIYAESVLEAIFDVARRSTTWQP